MKVQQGREKVLRAPRPSRWPCSRAVLEKEKPLGNRQARQRGATSEHSGPMKVILECHVLSQNYIGLPCRNGTLFWPSQYLYKQFCEHNAWHIMKNN